MNFTYLASNVYVFYQKFREVGIYVLYATEKQSTPGYSGTQIPEVYACPQSEVQHLCQHTLPLNLWFVHTLLILPRTLCQAAEALILPPSSLLCSSSTFPSHLIQN